MIAKNKSQKIIIFAITIFSQKSIMLLFQLHCQISDHYGNFISSLASKNANDIYSILIQKLRNFKLVQRTYLSNYLNQEHFSKPKHQHCNINKKPDCHKVHPSTGFEGRGLGEAVRYWGRTPINTILSYIKLYKMPIQQVRW